jgi:hypothetical protein
VVESSAESRIPRNSAQPAPHRTRRHNDRPSYNSIFAAGYGTGMSEAVLRDDCGERPRCGGEPTLSCFGLDAAFAPEPAGRRTHDGAADRT